MVRIKAALLLMALSAGLSLAAARQDADNTKMNKQSQNKTESADTAKNTKSDLQLMKEIRRAVVKDKSLSTYAHNVKIVAKNGKVTLRGPVKSDEEKQSIEQKAVEIAGSGNVSNEISVAASKQ
jgi:hyperosmotically inducible periplasmic protein